VETKDSSLFEKEDVEIIREALSHHLKGRRKRIDCFSFVGMAHGPRMGKTSEQAEDILR